MRTVLWALLLVLWLHEPAWALSQNALAKEGFWYKTTTGCKVWRGNQSPGLVATWNGWCENGLVNGYGALEYVYAHKGRRVVSHYEGAMFNGKPSGRGELSKPDGTRYKGGFKNGWTNGQGFAVYPSGERYEGEFVDGLPHGHGVMIYATGERHEGNFVQGAPQGDGVVIYPNGDRYEGEFLNGAAHGHGKYRWQRGNSYEGEFFYGLPHGVGKCRANSKPKGCQFEYGELIAWF